MSEGVDVAFKLGVLENSNLRMRAASRIASAWCVPRRNILKGDGTPQSPEALGRQASYAFCSAFPVPRNYCCCKPRGLAQIEVSRAFYGSDDGDVLTQWALGGRGIINKPLFEVKEYIRRRRLTPILQHTPPAPIQLAAIYPHKRLQDPKVPPYHRFHDRALPAAGSARRLPESPPEPL